ncbi:MAG: hypothetical protein AAF891_06585 [Pseudomonadota bacterium]
MKHAIPLIITAAIASFSPAASFANQWLEATPSEMRQGCYGRDKTSDKGPCLIGSDRHEANPSNCNLFSVREMITSCKELQALVHTPESCDAPVAARTCSTAQACVTAREGVQTYFNGSGVGNLGKALGYWGKNKASNQKLITLGKRIRTAMDDPVVVDGHRRALNAAKELRNGLCK